MERTVIKTKSMRGEADVRKAGRFWQVKLGTDLFEFAPEDAPKGVTAGKFIVSLSARGDKWYGISPITGTYDVVFKQFGGSKPGDPPKPIYDAGGPKRNPKTGQDWTADPSLSTLAVCEILGPKCAGMQATIFMPYPIAQSDTKPGMAKLQGTEGQMEKWETFVGTFGLDEDVDIPYPEGGNVLPWLEKRLLAENVQAQVTIVDGKVQALTAGDEPVRKPAKKQTPARRQPARR